MNLLGCILPSAHTSASLAAGILLATYGANAFSLNSYYKDSLYESVKKRLKQLYNKEPLVYLVKLPPSPADLVRLNREFALSIYNPQDPPMACPLPLVALRQMKSQINLKGGCKAVAAPHVLQLGAFGAGVPPVESTPTQSIGLRIFQGMEKRVEDRVAKSQEVLAIADAASDRAEKGEAETPPLQEATASLKPEPIATSVSASISTHILV